MSFLTVRNDKIAEGIGLLGLWVLDDHAFFSERLKIWMPPLALTCHEGTGTNPVMNQKTASTDYPIHDLLAARWSPYGFDDRSVAIADIRSLFEAARWAPSSYNEQPWSYLVARREEPEEFSKLLS